jgi:hypothetical protein
MAQPKKADPDRADEAPAEAPVSPKKPTSRATGATYYAGAWYAADGTPLTDAESQEAQRAADAAAFAAREAATGGPII